MSATFAVSLSPPEDHGMPSPALDHLMNAEEYKPLRRVRRSPPSVAKSWSKPLGKYNSGRWSEEEHLIFLACFLEFGKDWKQMEYYVQTRSACQCRSHAQKVLKKLERVDVVKELAKLKRQLRNFPQNHRYGDLMALKENFMPNEVSHISLAGLQSTKGVKRSQLKRSNQKQRYEENEGLPSLPKNR